MHATMGYFRPWVIARALRRCGSIRPLLQHPPIVREPGPPPPPPFFPAPPSSDTGLCDHGGWPNDAMNPNMIGGEGTVPGGITAGPEHGILDPAGTRSTGLRHCFRSGDRDAPAGGETARRGTVHHHVSGPMDSGSADVRLPRYIEGVGGRGAPHGVPSRQSSRMVIGLILAVAWQTSSTVDHRHGTIVLVDRCTAKFMA